MATAINFGNQNKGIFSASRKRRRLNKIAYNQMKKTKTDSKPKYLLVYLILAAGLVSLVVWEFINSA